MDKITMLKSYLDRLTADTGWDIMIDGIFCGSFSHSELTPYFGCVKWHCNPYCLTVKKSTRIHSICINTIPMKRKKIRKNPVASWYVCHCGVAEYTVPVVVNGFVVAVIYATGFKGRLSENMARLIAKRVDTPTEKLKEIRDMSLFDCDEECQKRLECYLDVAADMIRSLAEESPLIKKRTSENALDEGRRYVLKAIEYIEDNLGEQIPLDNIAKRCHISSSYLQHLFLKYYGEGISSYIRRRRMERACELLCSSDRTVRDIAINCGFYDTDYFSVSFKKFYNTSPLAYRKAHKSKNL